MIRARVNVLLKEDVMDPQGKAVGEALNSLGHHEVRNVRVGRCFDLNLTGEDPAAARVAIVEMCEQLLANTVIEKYDIHLVSAAGGMS
ncbi:MAG: phosphoribosylformylglycinamidine synthase subunit PurS [Candidatus Sumerlaeaceae bacterium]|nr:phosphoribosylformylglycinamidine synthase subunit PurS [Candidatus Sumerlaeaceae bacterium]